MSEEHADYQTGKTDYRCSIIIPTRDKLEFLEPCLEGIFASQLSEEVEILIVDNDSQEAATRDYLAALNNRPNCRVLSWNEKFNYSAINNFAVEQASAPIVCFLNNDIEINQPDWLERQLRLAQREDVGAVGCLLLYPDASIQHAGIALDELAIARHIAHGENQDYLQQKGLLHPYVVDAATAACLFMRKALFQKLGGFNESSLAVAFNDVDLCLRISDKGLPIVLNPAVSLIHHESVSRKSDVLPANRSRAQQEYQYMLLRWQHRLTDKRFAQGLPANIQQAQDTGDAAIAALLNAETERLYREPQLTLPRSENTRPGADIAEGDASYWRREYHELAGHNEALKKHVADLQALNDRLLSSPLLRLGKPLQKIRQLLRGSPEAAAPAAADEQQVVVNPEPEVQHSEGDEENFKQTFRQQAAGRLQRFLASDESLDFSHEGECELTVLLIFYNQAALSYLCLESLLEYGDLPFELLIIDNQSSDETGQLLTRIKGARIVRNDDNLGFVKAVNQGAKLASGKYLLLLNNDAMIGKACLSAAVATLEDDDSIGAVGGRIDLLDGSLQEAGSIIWNDGACLGYGRGDNPAAPAYLFQRDVDYCSGACLLLRTGLFLDMGGFDEDYAPAYYEESDYCLRLHERGLRVVYNPKVQITHFEFASSQGFSGASALQAEHRQLLCQKHPEFLASRLDNDPANALKARNFYHQRANILVLDDRVPHPSLGAGYPRAAHLLTELSRMDCNITLLPMLFPNDDWQQVYTTLPHSIEVMLGIGEAQLGRFLEERKGYYNTIVVSREHNMAAFNRIMAERSELLAGIELIYDAEAVSAPREILRRRLLGEQISSEQEQQAIDAELELARGADRIVAVSAQEAAYFKSAGFNCTSVLGHTMQTRSDGPRFSERSGLLFVGALRDEGSPNVDSLLWFIINVWPLIEQALPDVQLTVVGDNKAPSLATIDKANIVFTGRVESINKIYDSSRVFIAPTRFAAGIPHKIHEASGHGLPTVSTSLLAQQLSWRDGEELLVADVAADFARQCLRLHNDETLWNKIRQSGLAAVNRDCSQQGFRAAIHEIFTSGSSNDTRSAAPDDT
jgi:GT2 family glycosyltransferase/glycosyltransferase involved in cell wall biosynthesis